MAYVVVRDHNGKVLQKMTLERSVTIGRSEKCDIRIQDTQISRRHCELVPDGKGWKLRDLQSRNGTCVKGHPVRECHLRDGATFEVGPFRISFFAAATRRTRAADPVRAGLVDAESAPAGPTTSVEPSTLGHSESSLFATRVMVLPSDESTIAGVRGYVPTAGAAPARTPAVAAARRTSAGKLTGGVRRAIVGAAALTTTFIIIWLYFAA